MKPSSIFLAALIALTAVPLASAQQRLVVETGHIGAVNALAYDKKDSLLFSGGSDGTVRAWDMSNRELVGTLQVGHLPVRMLAVNPLSHEIATFETDNINTFRITAWNWETGKRLFSHDLSETPLFMKYSPSGNFLVYGVTNWRSLNFLDSSTGETLPYFQGGIGIVSDVIISDSEKSIMTYSPSGQIEYWTLDSGTLRQSYHTLPNLSAISFTPNNRYLIGAYNDNLVMIDLVGGQTVASTALPGIEDTSLDPSTNEVAVYSNGGNGPELSLYSLTNGFIRMGSAFSAPQSPVNDLEFIDGVLISAENGSPLSAERPYFSPSGFGVNNLLQINDIAVNSDKMVLTSQNHILSLGSSILDMTDSTQAQSVSFSRTANPYGGPTGALALRDGRFVLWNLNGQNGSYRIYGSFGIGSAIGNFPAPFVDVRDAGSELLTLDSQGTVNLLNIDSGVSTFNYTAFGLQSVAYINPQKIIAGRSQSGALNTALLQINPVTEETVPIPDSSIVVFDMAYDSANQELYTLDIENSSSGTSTVLKAHQLSTLDRGEKLLSYSGEDHTSGLAVDSAANSVYSSLGFDGVKEIMPDNGNTTNLAPTDHIPRKLLVHGDWVISLNTDSTVTVWSRLTGQRVLDLYLFKNLSWAAVLRSGQFISSPGAEQYLKVFNGMKPSSESLQSFQYRF